MTCKIALVLKKIAQRLGIKSPDSGLPASESSQPARPGILDEYVRHMPSPQFAVDLFKGQWWSALPASFGVATGRTPHFEDSRIAWAIPKLGGVEGKRILELGPMEGGHTYMLEKAGASSVTAVEASSRAYLKCLIAKEVTGMRRESFLLGDFEEYLRHAQERFDAVIACGVLYHLKNPVETIHNLARFADRAYVWTHYYVKERIDRIAHMQQGSWAAHEAEHAGFKYTAHRFDYGKFLDTNRFAGGSDQYAHWLGREELLGALRHAGYDQIDIGEEDLEHPNGPCISLVAIRTRG